MGATSLPTIFSVHLSACLHSSLGLQFMCSHLFMIVPYEIKTGNLQIVFRTWSRKWCAGEAFMRETAVLIDVYSIWRAAGWPAQRSFIWFKDSDLGSKGQSRIIRLSKYLYILCMAPRVFRLIPSSATQKLFTDVSRNCRVLEQHCLSWQRI